MKEQEMEKEFQQEHERMKRCAEAMQKQAEQEQRRIEQEHELMKRAYNRVIQ